MNASGDAAEQVVRMSLEGVEVAARISGQGAKLLALHIAAAVKEEQKTKGKARLSSMLKSGKPLKVYEVRQKDLATFAKEAKRYGVLYCVLKDRGNKDENAMVDVIARVEDASKIQRITDRFQLVAMDTASVISSVEKARDESQKGVQEKDHADLERGERVMKPLKKEEPSVNPTVAKTEDGRPSEPGSKRSSRSESQGQEDSKPSVREKLEGYRKDLERGRAERERERGAMQRGRSFTEGKHIPRAPKGEAKER